MKKKMVFITGATGFLGQHLVPHLMKQGFRVAALVRNKKKITIFGQNASKIIWCTKESEIDRVFNQGVDCVIHCATSYGREKDTFADVVEANVLLPVNILEKACMYGCPLFINTDTFFHEKLGLKSKEKSYITTKKLFLELARSIIQGSDMCFVNMRLEQMYGPFDSRDKFVMSIIQQLRAGIPQIKLTEGKQKRDMVFVGDVARAYTSVIAHADTLKQWEEFGIGTGSSVSIKNIITFLKKETKSDSHLLWGQIPYREHEIMDSKAQVKNNKKIEWKAGVGWKQGLQKTIESLL